MAQKSKIENLAELYALAVCAGLFARDMQIIIERKIIKIASLKGYAPGAIESIINTTVQSCDATNAQESVNTQPPSEYIPVENAPLTADEFVKSYRDYQFAQRVAELTKDIDIQHAKIDALQLVPDDWEGTVADYRKLQKPKIDHERFVRDEKSKLRTQYKNEETTDYIVEKFTKEALAEWKRTGGILPPAAKEKRMEKLQSIIFYEDSKDEQFYPTPAKIIANYLLPNAQITDGMSILEPSAGKGDIADMIREQFPACDIDTIELSPIRNEYLRLKGYRVIGTDFMKTTPPRLYDRIIMNPPFLRTMSIAHVTRAYNQFLRPGGVLVAIINAGAYTNTQEFDSIKFRRDLVEKHGRTYGITAKEYNEGIEREITINIAVIVLEKPLVDESDIPREVLATPAIGQTIEGVSNSKRYKVTGVYAREFSAETKSGAEIFIAKNEFYADDWKIVDAEGGYVLPERSAYKDEGFQKVEFVTARADITNTKVPDFVGEFIPYDSNGKTKIKDHVIFGANYGILSMNTRDGFLNCDGTGTGKTVQQLLIALYYVKKYNKPVLIMTETDSIIEQSFFGDAKNLLGLSVPDARSEQVKKEIKRPANYSGLYDKFDQSSITVHRFNPKLPMKPGINIGTYHDLSGLKWGDEPLFEAVKAAKLARKKADDEYALEGKAINERFGKKPTKEEVKMRDEMLEARKKRRGSDPRYPNVIVAEDAWYERQRVLLKVWVDNIAAVIFDECQNLKNTGGDTLRANRAQIVIDDSPRAAFFSATPADKAGDIFYLKKTGIHRSNEEFARLMQGVGFYETEPIENDLGQVIRRATWTSAGKFPVSETRYGISKIFEMLTEDGGMLKREIQLKNLTSIMVDTPVPSSVGALMETIADAVTEDFCKNHSSADGGCFVPDALINMEQKRALEPYKVGYAIDLTKKEIEAGRNVIIFCDLVDDGDKEKAWGGKKEGVVRILKERLGAIYGDDMVGVIIGTHSEYEKQEKFKNISSFQKREGGKRILIATVGSGGTGISLDDVHGNAPRTMIIITAPFSSIKSVQILGRIVRVNSVSRATAYFLFADVAVDEWLKNILATKMIMLGGIVAGEVALLSPHEIEAMEAGGDDGANSITANDGEGTPKKKVQHKYFQHKHNVWIDGSTLPQKKPYSIQKYRGTMYKWKGEDLRVKSTSKAAILKFGEVYKSDLAKYGFTRESDRYEGTYYTAKYTDEGWNFLLNIILPQQQKYMTIPGQAFQVGDRVKLLEDELTTGQPIGTAGIIEKVRPRSTYYLYDVAFGGTIAKSVDQDILAFNVSASEEFDHRIASNRLGGYETMNKEKSQREIKFESLCGLFDQAVQANVIQSYLAEVISKKLVKIAQANNWEYSPNGQNEKKPTDSSEEMAHVSQVPIDAIRTDEARFQPRERLVEDNVERIIKNFNPIKFKPVTLWRDEKDRITLIAGHHRLEAMKRIGRKTIPAVWFTGTGQEAEDFGQVDNAGRQRQVAAENAKFIRKLRERGLNETELKAKCKSEYGMECTSAYYLSFLSVDGIALQSVNSFPNPDTDDAKTVSTLATWTGKIKENHPRLTTSQENEIYKFAFDNFKKFGRKFNSYQEFSGFVNGVLDRKFFGGETDETPINFANLKVRSETENEIDQRIEEARKAMLKAQSELHKRVMEIEKKRQDGEVVSQETVDRVLGKYQDQALKAERLYSREVLTKNERVGQVRSSESTLFGLSDKFNEQCPPMDSDGTYCIDPECIEALEECIARQPDTKSLWLDEEGDYKTERWELHNEIIADIMKDAHCIKRAKPIAILTGGASGSGKSTFLKKFRKYLTSDSLVKIDIDSFRDYLPEYKGWNANATQTEVKDIYNRIIDNLHAGDCKYDIILDGTMNKAKNYIPLIERLKSYGYQVFVIYVRVNKSTSEERVKTRYKRSGRYVPQFVIDEIFENGEAPMRKIVESVDGYIIVDNENDGKIIERGGKPIPKDRNYSVLNDEYVAPIGGCLSCGDNDNLSDNFQGKETVPTQEFPKIPMDIAQQIGDAIERAPQLQFARIIKNAGVANIAIRALKANNIITPENQSAWIRDSVTLTDNGITMIKEGLWKVLFPHTLTSDFPEYVVERILKNYRSFLELKKNGPLFLQFEIALELGKDWKADGRTFEEYCAATVFDNPLDGEEFAFLCPFLYELKSDKFAWLLKKYVQWNGKTDRATFLRSLGADIGEKTTRQAKYGLSDHYVWN